VTPRPANASDLRAVVDLTRRAYAPYEALLGITPMPMTEDYAPRIADDEVWLLEDGKEPIGLIVLEDHGDRSLLYSVAVAPERQGAGIGRLLLAFAEEIAGKRGQRTLALYTNARMERNIRIYTRCGFWETRRNPHPDRPGSVVIHMEKQLTDAST
jgi:GNAT superfamily N-acetyltransferase